MNELSTEAQRVLSHLGSVHRGYKTTQSTKIARELLLHCDGWGFWNGLKYTVKTKALGAGVYHVWLEGEKL